MANFRAMNFVEWSQPFGPADPSSPSVALFSGPVYIIANFWLCSTGYCYFATMNQNRTVKLKDMEIFDRPHQFIFVESNTVNIVSTLLLPAQCLPASKTTRINFPVNKPVSLAIFLSTHHVLSGHVVNQAIEHVKVRL